MNDFGIRLKRAMEERSISAAQLSKLSGVSKGLISYYINGKCIAKQDKIYLLAKALSVDPGWLMTGVEQVCHPDTLDSDKLRKIIMSMPPADYQMVWAAIDRNYKRLKENGEIE
jgi:transcriptional regulator with XRE-family HTH domain